MFRLEKDKDDIKRSIEDLLSDQPCTAGYRNMTGILRQRGVHVRRDTVMELMRELDPIGVELRRKRRVRKRIYRSFGPNHTWHIDGYDKLKPFGLPIHGCIDGFSRKILWLKVASTNNDPSVTAFNYVECIEKMKGCPLILQPDPGTENTITGAIQCTLRDGGTDIFSGINCYRVVRSTLNQRIEAWWSMFRRQKTDWWINLFKDLESFGGFRAGNMHDIKCARYCFIPCIQLELDQLVERWNNHHISISRNAECPNGRPTVLFSIPEENGACDCIQNIDEKDVEFAYSQCKIPSRSGSPEFDAAAFLEFTRLQWEDAVYWKDPLQNYFHLRNIEY